MSRPGGDEGLAVRLAANSIVQIAGSALAAGISFFTFVAMTRGLGPDAYGDYVAAISFLFLPIVLSDLGLATTVLRDISAEPDRTEPVMRRSMPLRALISAVAVAVMVGVGLLVPFEERTKVAMLIWSVGAYATLMNVAVLPVLQARLRMEWAVVANVAGRVVSLVLTLAALAADLGFTGVVWAQVIGVVVTFLFDVAVVNRMVSLRPVLDLPYWRQLVRGSLVIGLAIGLGQVFFKVDGVILALVRPSIEVGFYGAAYKFLELSDMVVAAIALSVFPTLTHFVSTGNPRLRGIVQRTFEAMLAVTIPLALIMLAFPEELIALTAGSEFASGADALRILAPYPVLSIVNALFWRVLIAGGEDRLLLGIATSVLTLNVALNIALLPPYGFKAAAVTALVSEVFSLTTAAVFLRRKMGFLPTPAYLPVLAVAAGVMAALAFLVPGPAIGAASAALAAYLGILLLAPGTMRIGFGRLLRSLRSTPALDDAPEVRPRAEVAALTSSGVEVSVVIPALNSARTIALQLESLARQTWNGSWEVIVADNGSTDGTIPIVESFRDRLPGLRVVDASAERGVAYARNRGTEAARGRLLAFCDADDEVSDDWLAAIVRGLERFEAVATPRDHERLNEPWVRESRDPPTPTGTQDNWFPPFIPHTGTGGLGIHRELHDAIGGFDESFRACEDDDYSFRLQLHGGRLGHVEDAVYHYRFKSTLGGIFRQALVYAQENARLQRKYRTPGVRVPDTWKWPIRYWPTIAKAVPGTVRKGGRAKFVWLLGWQLGRYLGSARHRVLAI